MTGISTQHLRVFEPFPGLLVFYDGRVANTRLYSDAPNWLDDGGFALGIASYVVWDGDQALVYDTHMSPEHAGAIRAVLELRGLTRIRVVLSHHHQDHVAGNAVFADCEIWAEARCAAALRKHERAFAGSNPPITPVIHPTHVFAGEKTLRIGRKIVQLLPFDIHSSDGLVLYLPKDRILLAGDTLEDPVTYFAEPDRIGTHLDELSRLETLEIDAIYPNHGCPERIASGGYGPDLIAATRSYLQKMQAVASNPVLGETDLKRFMAPELASGAIAYYPEYEAVHSGNIKQVLNPSDH